MTARWAAADDDEDIGPFASELPAAPATGGPAPLPEWVKTHMTEVEASCVPVTNGSNIRRVMSYNVMMPILFLDCAGCRQRRQISQRRTGTTRIWSYPRLGTLWRNAKSRARATCGFCTTMSWARSPEKGHGWEIYVEHKVEFLWQGEDHGVDGEECSEVMAQLLHAEKDAQVGKQKSAAAKARNREQALPPITDGSDKANKGHECCCGNKAIYNAFIKVHSLLRRMHKDPNRPLESTLSPPPCPMMTLAAPLRILAACQMRRTLVVHFVMYYRLKLPSFACCRRLSRRS